MMNKIPYWLKNKYSITFLVFLIWLAFVDQNDMITQYSYHRDLRKLKSERDYFKEATEKTRQELEDLTKNPATLEKFARENYFMKKNNEEVFVFTTK
jgi:cell division protein FtsB